MPLNVARTLRQEKLWRRATQAAGHKYKGDTKYKVIMTIFKKMKANQQKKG